MQIALEEKLRLERQPETDGERYTVRQLKTALNRLGWYKPDPATGMTDDIDETFKDAIYAYQRKSTIFFNDVGLGPGSTTERILNRDLSAMNDDTRYIWRTVGDGKVRGEHASRNGQTYSWSNPPDGENPGEDYNCRCWAEPMAKTYHPWIDWVNERQQQRLVQSSTAEELTPPRGLKDDITDLKTPIDAIKPVNLAWSAAAILTILQLGGTVPVARILAAVSPKNPIKSPRRHTVDRHLYKKPEGVPRDWVEAPHKSGGKYISTKRNDDRLWISKGNPGATFEGQRYDYVRWQKGGKALDINGNIVEPKSLESHIPLKDFKFKPELFE